MFITRILKIYMFMLKLIIKLFIILFSFFFFGIFIDIEFFDIVLAESKNPENNNNLSILNIIIINIFFFLFIYILYKLFYGNLSQVIDVTEASNEKKVIINREHLEFLQKLVDKKNAEEALDLSKKKEFSLYEEYYKETSKFYSKPESK